jgi:DNA-binding NarL/FixJ family response regulator
VRFNELEIFPHRHDKHPEARGIIFLKRIIIVEDHSLVTAGIYKAIEPLEGIVVEKTFENLAEAHRQVLALRPNLVILDNRLPDGSGTDLVRSVRPTLPDLKWLLMSAYISTAVMRDVLELKIDGAAHKSIPLLTLATAIKEILNGNRFFCQRCSEAMILTPERFNPTERRILYLVSMGHEAKEIAAILGIAHKSVLNALVVLRSKTECDSMVKLSDFTRQHGVGLAPGRQA